MTYKISQFLPLIAIFAIILLFTLGSFVLSDYDFTVLPRMFMAGFFLVFGIFKVVRLKGFAKAYQEYDIIAKRSKSYSFTYPFLEIGLGLMYLLNWQILAALIITIPLMLVSSIGVYQKLAKREKIICACLGVVFKIPMTWVTLIEDILMIIMAIVMIILYLM